MDDILLENLETIQQKIGNRKVELLAVTKTVPVERINLAIMKGGIRAIGENRVQELLQKYDYLERRDEIDVHLIGHLQTNKVKYIIDKVDLIQSVDSKKLVDEIQKQAEKIGKIQNILIEVNIGEEESKSGIAPDMLPSLLEYVRTKRNILCRGLMCIPPICKDRCKLSEYFQQMQKLLVDNIAEKLDNIDDYILSMGMSGDYEIAIENGSNMIRIGSALFGKRN